MVGSIKVQYTSFGLLFKENDEMSSYKTKIFFVRDTVEAYDAFREPLRMSRQTPATKAEKIKVRK